MNSPLTLPRFEFRSVAAIKNDIKDELEFHIQCRIDDLVADGMSVEDATQKANEDFGCTETIRKQCEQIGFGGNRLLLGIAAGLIVAMAAVSCWLGWQLMLARSQNLEISQQLLAASNVVVPAAMQDDEFLDYSGTITDAEGPVADAQVLVVYKSFPGGAYQQEFFTTTTDAKGKFVFEDLYTTDTETAFLVSVVKDGYQLKSKYMRYRRKQKAKSVKLKIDEAIAKTFTILDSNGKPLANTDVFLRSRNMSRDGNSGNFIFPQMREDIMLSTNEDGKVSMNFFKEKDKAVIAAIINDQIVDYQFKVSGEEQQTVGGPDSEGSGKSSVTGKVKDKSGNPVEGASVLLVHKDWEQGFRQDVFKTETDAEGKFVFPNRYDPEQRYGFLVSIVADGSVLESKYVFKQNGGKQRPFNFRLESATPKTFVFEDSNGSLLSEVAVFPSGRKTASGKDHLIYAQSRPDIEAVTDADGKVSFNHFKSGDTALFGLSDGREVEVKVNSDAEQIVSLKKK